MIAYVIAVYLAALAILLYRLTKLSGRRQWLTFIGVMALGALLFAHEGTGAFLLLLSGIVIFNAILSSYGTRLCYLFIAVGAAYSAFAYGLGANLFMQSLFLGMLSGSYIDEERKKGAMPRKGVLLRNALQIAAGAVFMLVAYFLGIGAVAIALLALVLVGSALGNYALHKRNWFARILYTIEKEDTMLGSGARWLAVGAVVAVSFLARDMTVIVFSAIFLGDSFSTLVGTYFKTAKLFYNRKKSVGGTLAYFASVLAVSWPLIGTASLPIAAAAAMFESQPLHIDDNFDVAVAMVAVIFLMVKFGALAMV